MNKVLFVAMDHIQQGSVERYIRKVVTEKPFLFLSAKTTQEVTTACINHPDIETVVLVGFLTDIPISSSFQPNTVALVEKIREMLGDGVKIYTASPEEKFNARLMTAGCDEAIDLGHISVRLAQLLA